MCGRVVLERDAMLVQKMRLEEVLIADLLLAYVAEGLHVGCELGDGRLAAC